MKKYHGLGEQACIFNMSLIIVLIISGSAIGVHQPTTPANMEKIESGSLNLEMTMISGDDEVYTHTYHEWIIQIVVFNSGDYIYTELDVTSVLPAEIDCLDYEISRGILEISKHGKGKSGSRDILWSIGTLEEHKDATLILTLYTLHNPAGKQEFTSPGEYVIIEGVSMVGYESSSDTKILMGPTEPILVNAIEKEDAPEVPEEPEEPEEPEVPEVPEVPEEPEEPEEPEVPVTIIIESLKLELKMIAGEEVVYTHSLNEWEIEINITNCGETDISNISLTAAIPAEIECTGYMFSHGTFHLKKNGEGKSGSWALSLKIEMIQANETITLSLRLSTTKNAAGKQEFTSPGEYNLIEDVQLKYKDKEVCSVDPLVVIAEDEELPEDPEIGENSLFIDVLFLLDSTGSMGDEISVVKAEIEKIMYEVQNGTPKPIVRYAIVTYRDRGDIYITKTMDFSRNIEDIKSFLNMIGAGGGGDGPESVNEGLHVAINDCNWGGDETIKIIFLIGDAPPHMNYEDDYDYRDEVIIAKEKGIKINVIGCSGITYYSNGESIFREIANRTNGTYQKLIYTPGGGGYGGGGYAGGSTPGKYYYPVTGEEVTKTIAPPYKRYDYSIGIGYNYTIMPIRSPFAFKDTCDYIYITADCDSDGLSYESCGATITTSGSYSTHTARSYGNSNMLDVQLTYLIQQEAILNGVTYENEVSLTTP